MLLNRRRFLLSLSLSLLGTLVLPVEIKGQSNRSVRDIAKQITVQLLYPGTSGSGILLYKDEQTYVVLTAKHVVANTQNNEEAYVKIYDQQQYPVQHQATYLLSDIDAALIQFQSNRNYATATIGDSSQLTETDELFVSGFPLPGTAIQTSNFTITKGVLTGKGEATRGYEFIYDNVTQAGMSGGPVLNKLGHLVGIHGLAEGERIQGISVKAGLNLGIPIQSVLPWIPFPLETAMASNNVLSKVQASPAGEDFEQYLQEYFSTLASLIERRNARDLFAFMPIDQDRYRYKRLSGQVQTYDARVDFITQMYRTARRRQEVWRNIQFKIDSIQYTSTTEAIVSHTQTGNWSALLGLTRGRIRTRRTSRWEKVNGQWMILEIEEIPAN